MHFKYTEHFDFLGVGGTPISSQSLEGNAHIYLVKYWPV